jgi:hypothetical protein
MKAEELAVISRGCWRNIAISLKILSTPIQSVSDTWGLAKVVRKVEFKLLHLTGLRDTPQHLPELQQSHFVPDDFFFGAHLTSSSALVARV